MANLLDASSPQTQPCFTNQRMGQPDEPPGKHHITEVMTTLHDASQADEATSAQTQNQPASTRGSRAPHAPGHPNETTRCMAAHK